MGSLNNCHVHFKPQRLVNDHHKKGHQIGHVVTCLTTKTIVLGSITVVNQKLPICNPVM